MLRNSQTNVATWLSVLSLPVWVVSAQSIASEAYTPIAGACPEGFELVRMAGPSGNQALSSSEAACVQARRSQVIPEAWKTYLANVEATDVTLPSYELAVQIAFAFSEFVSNMAAQTHSPGAADWRLGTRSTGGTAFERLVLLALWNVYDNHWMAEVYVDFR